LNKNLNLQRSKVLYVSSNYSGILSKLGHRFTELEVRRGFTVFQFMTILGDASKDAAVLLYSPAVDPFLEDLMKNADRVFYFNERQGASSKIVAKALSKTQRDQATLEAFS